MHGGVVVRVVEATVLLLLGVLCAIVVDALAGLGTVPVLGDPHAATATTQATVMTITDRGPS